MDVGAAVLMVLAAGVELLTPHRTAARGCQAVPGLHEVGMRLRMRDIMQPPSSSRDWHAVMRAWAKPPSETEDQRASNAAGMIRTAIRASDALKGKTVDVYPTGSYRNNTNARLESDVDVAVVLRDLMFSEIPSAFTKEQLGITSTTSYSFNQFREDVGAALKAKFGAGMTPGDKAFDIRENSYRLDADVAPFFEHRRYTGARGADGTWQFYEGVEMRPRSDANKRIINWHQQHYDQGVAKNTATGRRFKRVTRILKRLRTEMLGAGDERARKAAKPIASFLIESLVYNVPNGQFNQATETYYEDTKAVVSWLWNRIDKNEHNEFKETSEMKWLFRSGQAWTAADAKEFLAAAWSCVGFEKS